MTSDDRSRPRGNPATTGLAGEMARLLGTPAAAARADAGREFAFSAADFERVRKLIHEHAGIVLAPSKQDMVYSRLTRRLRACGLRDFSAYLDRIGRDRTEWEAFVNALTTNLTSFFRESHHFDILAEHFRCLGGGRTLNVWCCAASTGEEPYSLAITACEAFNSLNPPVRILASDVNTEVLAHAQRGRYAVERVGLLKGPRLERYLSRVVEGREAGYQVRPELQRLLTFRRVNLLDPAWPVPTGLDAIFCRNVMIYFDKPTQYGILKRFAPLLREDGLLFAGHSESFFHAADLFRPLGKTVYRRAG